MAIALGSVLVFRSYRTGPWLSHWALSFYLLKAIAQGRGCRTGPCFAIALGPVLPFNFKGQRTGPVAIALGPPYLVKASALGLLLSHWAILNT